MINQTVANTVKNQLEKSRIVNVRIPASEPFAGILDLSKYNIFKYDVTENKLRRTKSRLNLFLRMLVWLFKVAAFIVECFISLGFSLSTMSSLCFELIGNGAEFIKKDNDYDDNFFKALSKCHFKFRKNPCKKYKKIKNIIYIYFENEPEKKTYNSILFLCELIECKRMTDTAVVIISKTELKVPPQCVVQIEDNEIDNDFICDFSLELLESIRQEQYESTATLIRQFLDEKGIVEPIKFEFILQCLAFCYRHLNVNEFKAQFPDFGVTAQLDAAKQNKFITSYGQDANFLKFCYEYFPKFYRNRSPVDSDELDSSFKKAVQNIKIALDSRDEYFSAAKLFAKFATTENAADSYIIAFLHNEFVKDVVNNECYRAIENYAQSSNRAKLFLELFEQNNKSQPDANKTKAIIGAIRENTTPILRLCFYYYAVNSLYKNDCCEETFLNSYKADYFELDDSEPLKCIFGAQFLLLYTTIEDRGMRKNIDKSVSIMLNYVLTRCELLKDKKTYVKICRSLNGLRVDCFGENIVKMESIEETAERIISERVYYYLNLGATYVFRSDTAKKDYNKAIASYGKIKSEIDSYPLCIRATYFNNLTVFKYLRAPSPDMANKCFQNLENYVKKNYAHQSVSEEQRHIAINLVIFAILEGKTEQEVTVLFRDAEDIIGSDNYFRFYLDQAKLLYSALHGINAPEETAPESVFFINKKSFFKQKRNIMLRLSKEGETTVEKLNSVLTEKLGTLTGDYNYFKRADLFSLVERWYE